MLNRIFYIYLGIIRFKLHSKCFVSPGVSTNYVSSIEVVAIKSTAACGTIMYFLCHLQAENCSPSLFHNVSSFYHFKDFFPNVAFFILNIFYCSIFSIWRIEYVERRQDAQQNTSPSKIGLSKGGKF